MNAETKNGVDAGVDPAKDAGTKSVSAAIDPAKDAKWFIIWVFVIWGILGLLAASSWSVYVSKTEEKWTRADTFQILMILSSTCFVFPCLSVSIRTMYRGIVRTETVAQVISDLHNKSEPIFNTLRPIVDQAGPIVTSTKSIVDKAGPIVANFEIVLGKAKDMSADIVEIAHRVRTATEAMNGSFNVKALEEKLTQVADSLNVIASIFKPFAKVGGAAADMLKGLSAGIPEFDPLKTGRRKG